MKLANRADLISGLQSAVDGKNICVQAWLGYADVLFLGFGTAVMAHVLPGEKHSVPPYEVVTHMSNWTVYSNSHIEGSSHDDPRAQQAINLLVGLTPTRFWFSPDIRNLRVAFSGGVEISIIPYDLEEKDADDVWGLLLTDGRYLVVRNDLSIRKGE